MATGVSSWSKTAASNSNSDSNVNWAEGQAPSSVNDSARATMASVAMWRDDINGSIATGGSSTAYTVTSNQTFASLSAMANAVIAFVPHTTSGASPTLAVDGLAAKKIRFTTGNDLPAGALIAGTPYVATYYSSVGEFIIHNLGTFDHYCPIGVGFDYWASSAPNSSYAFAYGQAISRTTYSRLFALFSTTYGSGDGSTTFNIPDKRDRVSIAKGNMGGTAASRITTTHFTGDSTVLGATGGVESTTIGQANLPSVTLTTTISGSVTATYDKPAPSSITAQAGSGSGTQNLWQAGSVVSNASATVDSSGLSGSTPLGGSGTAVSRMPPGIVCNYIIRVL